MPDAVSGREWFGGITALLLPKKNSSLSNLLRFLSCLSSNTILISDVLASFPSPTGETEILMEDGSDCWTEGRKLRCRAAPVRQTFLDLSFVKNTV